MSESNPRKVSVGLIDVTPSLATNWLQQNANNNRHVRQARIELYAEDMRAGRWQLSDQAISFDAEGRLVNGQHRLEAVVLSATAIRSVVLRGLPPESMMVLDNGLRRSTDDNFKIAGYDYPHSSHSTVRRLWMGMSSANRIVVTDQEVAEFIRKHEVDVVWVHHHLARGRFALAGVRAVLLRAVIHGQPRDRLERFAEVLQSGLMDRGEDGAVLLRNRIVEKSDQVSTSKRQELYTYAEGALQAFLQGKQLTRLRPAAEELWPIKDESPRERPRRHRPNPSVLAG